MQLKRKLSERIPLRGVWQLAEHPEPAFDRWYNLGLCCGENHLCVQRGPSPSRSFSPFQVILSLVGLHLLGFH